jgi:nitrate reductase NapAB chaperone NapD
MFKVDQQTEYAFVIVIDGNNEENIIKSVGKVCNLDFSKSAKMDRIVKVNFCIV